MGGEGEETQDQRRAYLEGEETSATPHSKFGGGEDRTASTA